MTKRTKQKKKEQRKMPQTVTLNKIEHVLLLGLLFNGEVCHSKPIALTDDDCERAAKLLHDFAGQLRRKLLGAGANIAVPRPWQIRDRPDGLDYSLN
jgi:hypothetical protein